MIASSTHEKIGAGLLLLLGLLLTVGCAANNSRLDTAKARASNQDYLKAWKDATKQQSEQALAEDAAPAAEEPRMLPMTYFAAGALYEKQNRLAQAIEQYRKAIELNPSFAGAYSRLGLCYTKAGDFRQAVETLRKAVELQSSAFNWNNLGFAWLAAGNAEQAEPCFAKALAARPTYQRARTNMALALVRLGRDSEALAHLQSAAPDYIALYNLGRIQLAYDEPVKAKASLERALQIKAQFPAARKLLDETTVRLAAGTSPPAEPTAPATTGEPAGVAAAPSTQPAGTGDEQPVLAAAAPASRPAAVPAEAALPEADGSCADGHHETVAAAPASEPVADAEVEFALAASLLPRLDITADIADPGEPACRVAAPQRLVDLGDDDVTQLASDEATRRSADRKVSVADFDLVSLQYAAWRDAAGALDVDIHALPDGQMAAVMRKWLTALTQLEELVRLARPAFALAR